MWPPIETPRKAAALVCLSRATVAPPSCLCDTVTASISYIQSLAPLETLKRRRLKKMERFLRTWRQDAYDRGQFDSAVYIGDKVFALTSEASLAPSFLVRSLLTM